MTTRVTEHTALAVEADESTGSSRLMIDLITPGWGSSGYYSPKVLENAAQARVFPKGTKMFLDHPSETERRDRPERSVRDLAAVLEEDAEWSGSSLRAPVKVFNVYRELLTDEELVANIGTSIVAYAETTVGEAEGRKGTLVTELTEAFSVDFVTFPGRGGAVLAVLESARRDVAEASANDTREALSGAVRAAYSSEDTYVWVRDFDDESGTVWFSVEDADSTTTYQQGYTLDDAGTAALAEGDPTEVRARTEYVPVTASSEAADQPPVNPAGSHQSPEEDTMTDVSEARKTAELTEAEGRVREAEQRATEAEAKATTATERAERAERRAAAIEALADSGHVFTKLERRGLLAELPVTESGELDADKFKTVLAEAAVEGRQLPGITGFGTSGGGDGVGDDVSLDDYNAAFGGKGA